MTHEPIKEEKIYIPDVDMKIKSLITHAEKESAMESKHYAPCPQSKCDNIAQDADVNEWVFNHLALTEAQKEQVLKELTLEELKKNKQLKNSKIKIRRQYTKKPKKSERGLISIKEATKKLDDVISKKA